MATMPLREIDKVEIFTVSDNSIDMLMASTPQVRRLPLLPDALTRESLVAEHGFAALVTRQQRQCVRLPALRRGAEQEGAP